MADGPAGTASASAPLLGDEHGTDTEEKKRSGGAAATEDADDGQGNIGYFSSACLLFGNITGPGMVNIPAAFQASGWLLPTLLFVLVAYLSGVVSNYLAKAISLFPGNRGYRQRTEFNEIAKAVFPRWLYWTTLVLILGSLAANNVSAIVESAQTMDATLLAIFKKTCAVYVHPARSPGCVDTAASGSNSAFGNDYVISLGYIVVLCLTVPLGFLKLEDNMWVQQGGAIALTACVLIWLAQFFHSGLDTSRLPAANTAGFSSILSVVVFNFSFLPTLPSWLSEKGRAVRVAPTVWVSIAVSTVQFFIMGFFGALALDLGSGADLLAALTDPATPNVWVASKVATFIFPLAALLSGIPVIAIIIRYNLQQMRLPALWANVLSTVLPWTLALVFFTGTSLNNIVTWSSALLFGTLNFVLPIGVYIITERARRHALAAAASGEAALPAADVLALIASDGCVDVTHGHGHSHGHAHSHSHVHGTTTATLPPIVVVPDGSGSSAAISSSTARDASTSSKSVPVPLSVESAKSTGAVDTAGVAGPSAGSATVSRGASLSRSFQLLPFSQASSSGSKGASGHVRGASGSFSIGSSLNGSRMDIGRAGSFAAVADAAGRAVKSLFRSDAEVELALGAVAAAHEAHDRERPRGRRESIENALALGPVIDDLAAEAAAAAAAVASCGTCSPSPHRAGSAHSFAVPTTASGGAAVTASSGAGPGAVPALVHSTSAASALVVPRRVWLQHHRQVHPDSTGRRHSCVDGAASPDHRHASHTGRDGAVGREGSAAAAGTASGAAGVAGLSGAGGARDTAGRPPAPFRRASSADNRADTNSKSLPLSLPRQSSLPSHSRAASGPTAALGGDKALVAAAAAADAAASLPVTAIVASRSARASLFIGLHEPVAEDAPGHDDESGISERSVLPTLETSGAAATKAAPAAASLAAAEEASGAAAASGGGTGKAADDDDDGPEDVRDDELAPLLSRCFQPLRLAYWVLAVSIILSILTFALQVDSASAPATAAASGGGGGTNVTAATAMMSHAAEVLPDALDTIFGSSAAAAAGADVAPIPIF